MGTESPAKPILYAEDEENDLFLLRYAFRRAQVTCPVQAVTNGADAVAYLAGAGEFADRAAHPLPCLLLLDLNLPLLSGMEVLEWVRGQSALQHLPVVIFTSSEQPRDMERARELGATEYLLKPADPDEFVRLAEELKRRWLRNGVP